MDIGTIILAACFAVSAAIGIGVAFTTPAGILRSTARKMNAANSHPFWRNNYDEETNPASRLPMAGSIDVAGNAFGCSGLGLGDGINPASGLPMLGSIDVAGNAFGNSDSHLNW